MVELYITGKMVRLEYEKELSGGKSNERVGSEVLVLPAFWSVTAYCFQLKRILSKDLETDMHSTDCSL